MRRVRPVHVAMRLEREKADNPEGLPGWPAPAYGGGFEWNMEFKSITNLDKKGQNQVYAAISSAMALLGYDWMPGG